ncbi:hypothetical protein [Dactylosporangium cerinum]
MTIWPSRVRGGPGSGVWAGAGVADGGRSTPAPRATTSAPATIPHTVHASALRRRRWNAAA